MSSIAVIIVNHNTREHLRACLASVQQEALGEVIVIDNASSDGSVEMVQAYYPQVVLHASKENIGYGAAANLAVAFSTAKYVLLLNSDTLLQTGVLQALSIYLDRNPQAAVVGPRLVNPDGTLQASCHQTPGTLKWLFDNCTLSRLIRYIPVLRNYSLLTWSHNQARIVPWVLGAALAIRREAFEAVGGFDETFFMYFEETDICYRLNIEGWEVHFAPVATIMHVGGASTMQNSTDMAIQFSVSIMKFFQKHYSGLRLAGLVKVTKSRVLLRLIRDIIRFQITRDACKRARIDKDVAVWRDVLSGISREQGIHGSEHSTAVSNKGTGTLG